jgi:AraC-like DNA-binding protein
VELNLLQSGWLVYLLGGQKVRIAAGRLSVFWAAIPHQILEFGTDTRYFVATIPFPWFLQCRLPERLVQPLLQGTMIGDPETRNAEFDGALFTRWKSDLDEAREDLKKVVLLEMEARLQRLALALPSLQSSSAKAFHKRAILSDGSLNKVERMACLIAQRYTDRLTVDDISKAVGLHPNYAMSLFHKTFGTTLIEYLTHHRVSHAQRLLATTIDKVVDVAFSSGFNSISRFNEAFRRTCGCSPREYRKHHQLET